MIKRSSARVIRCYHQARRRAISLRNNRQVHNFIWLLEKLGIARKDALTSGFGEGE